MKTRAFTLLALLAASPAWARIIVDDSAQEPAAEPGIHVPAPAGGTNGGPASAAPQDTLSFLNKDQLHGLLVSIDNTGALHWRSPEAQDPIVFRPGNVAEVKLDSQQTPQGVAADRIALTNGDELPGTIVSMDDKTLLLDTNYAGRLSIARAMIRGITPASGAGSILYQGPSSLEGWTIGRMGDPRGWSFKDGALVGNSYGTIGRDVKFPDMSSAGFDVALEGNDQISIGIYADHPDNTSNCYMLQLSSGYAELQRFSRMSGSTVVGTAQLQNVLRPGKNHLELRTNKEKKSIWLVLDGKIARQWNDPADFNGAGTCLIFACQPGTMVRISNIKVTRWDGKFEDSSVAEAGTDMDTVELANEDKVSGQLENIRDGSAKFSSEYADMTIPLQRIAELHLATAHSSQAATNPSDVKANFPDGGSITMQLRQWDAKGCTGTSPNFGTAAFSPNAFSCIFFNLQSSDPNSVGADNSAPDSDAPDQEGNQ